METRSRPATRYTMAVRASGVAALALGVILVSSEPTRALVQAACEASFEPTAVPSESETAIVFYKLSEEIGELAGVSAEAGSGLLVTGHDSEMSTLSLNTADAKAGSWTLTFHGADDLTCTGAIEIAGSGDART